MPRKFPTQVVDLIDQYFPWAKDYTVSNASNTKRSEARFAGVTRLPGLVENLDQIPDELIVLGPKDAAEFLMAHAALRHEVQVLAREARDGVNWPMLDQRDCVEIVRTGLSKCPDEALSAAAGAELTFLKNADLERTLAMDVGSIERALANSEWKAATVIGGSVIEALLLWAINQRSPTDVSTALDAAVRSGNLTQRPHADRNRWDFIDLIEVAHSLTEISVDTRSSANPSRHFRNAIHPGVVERTGIRCDRGTAYTTYGAIFNVIRELAAKHP
jgi:hypothetical protein